jgi:hypothetical protein
MTDSPSRDNPLQERVRDVFQEMRAAGKSDIEIFSAFYDDLRRLARRKIAGNPPGPSMHGTRLVHELWIRLFGAGGPEFDW